MMNDRDISKLADRISQLAHDLKFALLKEDYNRADSVVLQIENTLASGNQFRQLYDETALSDVVHALEMYYETEEDVVENHSSLLEQLVLVRDLHSKLHAIFNPELTIESVLYEHLNDWTHLDDVKILDFVFDDATEKKLQRIRSGEVTATTLRDFFEVFYAQLDKSMKIAEIEKIRLAIEQTITAFDRLTKYTIQGLFVVGKYGEVAGISIKTIGKPVGQTSSINFNHEIKDPNMNNAALRALNCACDITSAVGEFNYAIEIARPYLDYTGNSIGLALGIGYISEIENWSISPYIGFTGHVDFKDGRVTSVQGIREKIEAAVRSGIREVFISSDDEHEVTDELRERIIIRSVVSLRDAIDKLKQRSFQTASPSLEAKITKASTSLKIQGFKRVERENREHQIQLKYWNGETIPVSVYPASHKYFVGGSNSIGQKKIVQEVFASVFSLGAEENSSGRTFEHKPKTRTIDVPTEDMKSRLKKFLHAQDGVEVGNAQYCDYVVKIKQDSYQININQYTKGKLVLQGKDDPLFDQIETQIEAILGMIKMNGDVTESQTKLQKQQEAVRAIDVGEEWVGTDESGKGDYYGPLVSAAVYVDHSIADMLVDIGVTDSKKLSDKRVTDLAPQIERICGNRCTHVVINPEAYNRLYNNMRSEGKNLNSLLAWTHVKALEEILPNFQPASPLTVIVDKFADENYIKSRFKAEKLIKDGQNVELRLIQLPKAEVNVAVAAASILARYYFLNQLKRLSEQYGVELPKGASNPKIVEIGKSIYRKSGLSELSKIAKLHFKTTGRIQNE